MKHVVQQATVTIAAGALLAVGLAAAPATAAAPGEPVINEFSASTDGTDVEYIELLGEPGADLSSYRVLEIEGDTGTTLGVVDEVISFGAPDADGRVLRNLAAN